jgi:sugar/nucleoside kinase (ribokinase family)
MSPKFDILGIGCATVDDLVTVGSYPAADVKLRVKRMERQFGGLTGTALIAAAKLGGACAFGGMLGSDDLSKSVEENFIRHGVDVVNLVRREDSKPIHAVIVVAEEEQTRTIFYEYDAPTGADPVGPSEGAILSSKVLFVDHLGLDGGIRAAGIARKAGIPVVGDLEESHHSMFEDLLDLVDHVVMSDDFARELTGAADPLSAIFDLWSASRNSVVITCGKEGAWYANAENRSPQYLPAYRVKAVDTTGCGDVFHGAYALGLAQGMDIHERVRFASAAAAVKATRSGGQKGSPTLNELNVFLTEGTVPS